MKYERDNIESVLNHLKGEILTNVFYYTKFDNQESNNSLSSEVVEISMYTIYFQTKSDKFFKIIVSDYYPYLGLEGLKIIDTIKLDNDIPIQTYHPFWANFINKKVVNCVLIESKNMHKNKEIVCPFGFKFTFEGNNHIYLFNLIAESYNDNEKLFELFRGEDIILFNNETELKNHIYFNEKKAFDDFNINQLELS